MKGKEMPWAGWPEKGLEGAPGAGVISMLRVQYCE